MFHDIYSRNFMARDNGELDKFERDKNLVFFLHTHRTHQIKSLSYEQCFSRVYVDFMLVRTLMSLLRENDFYIRNNEDLRSLFVNPFTILKTSKDERRLYLILDFDDTNKCI